MANCWGADQQEDKRLNGSILTGKPADAPVVWVEDMSKVIEYFFEPSDNRARVIEEMNGVCQRGDLFKTNSLLDLVDITYMGLTLSKNGEKILSGAPLVSVGFPTGNNFLSIIFTTDFSKKWTINIEKLREIFPNLTVGDVSPFFSAFLVLQREIKDGKTPNNGMLVSNEVMAQISLFPH